MDSRSRLLISASLVLAGAAIFATSFPARLEASAPQEVTVFNFKAPFQVPGRILPPGRYLFKLEQSDGELNIVEIKNPEESKVYGVFLVRPDYRWTAPGTPILTFDERQPGSTPAIKTWFYPGDKYGNEFLYAR
jgi:hypothetical protein